MSKSCECFPITNIPEYEGAAIYALIDEDGKAYVGSTKNLRSRIRQHNGLMRMILKHGISGLISKNLGEAVVSGKTFRCEILAKINIEMSKREIETIENVFIRHYGGYNKTYNHLYPRTIYKDDQA